jgi:hypothetical protein
MPNALAQIVNKLLAKSPQKEPSATPKKPANSKGWLARIFSFFSSKKSAIPQTPPSTPVPQVIKQAEEKVSIASEALRRAENNMVEVEIEASQKPYNSASESVTQAKKQLSAAVQDLKEAVAEHRDQVVSSGLPLKSAMVDLAKAKLHPYAVAQQAADRLAYVAENRAKRSGQAEVPIDVEVTKALHQASEELSFAAQRQVVLEGVVTDSDHGNSRMDLSNYVEKMAETASQIAEQAIQTAYQAPPTPASEGAHLPSWTTAGHHDNEDNFNITVEQDNGSSYKI